LTTPTPRNILRHELIGLEAKVIKDSNPSNVSIRGVIVNETRNTLSIKTSGSEKVIAKQRAIFIFNLGGTLVEVRGATLVGRPEDRVKKVSKRNW